MRRNIFCLGFALYMGLSIPDYFTTFTATYGHGPVNTGSQSFNSESSLMLHPACEELCCLVRMLKPWCTDADIANSIFETGAAVALIITMVLDNTVPGIISLPSIIATPLRLA